MINPEKFGEKFGDISLNIVGVYLFDLDSRRPSNIGIYKLDLDSRRFILVVVFRLAHQWHAGCVARIPLIERRRACICCRIKSCVRAQIRISHSHFAG